MPLILQSVDGSWQPLIEGTQIRIQSADGSWHWITIGGASAPAAVANAPFVVAAADGSVPNHRVLTQTPNQVLVTDGGAGGAVTLALPQDYHTAATPTLGGLTLNGNLLVRSQNEVRFYDNGNYIGFEAPALAADQIWVLPNADGAASEFLQTDGVGNLTWAAGGGSPGGANKQVQFNNSGAFGGAAGFEYQAAASPNVTIVAQNATYIPLRLKLAAAQSVNALEVQDSAGNVLLQINSSGVFQSKDASSAAAVFRDYSNHSGYILEIRRSDNQALAWFGRDADNRGQLTIWNPLGNVSLWNAGGALIIDTGQTALFRLTPYANDIYFQNSVLAGQIYFTGHSNQQLTGKAIFKTNGVEYRYSGSATNTVVTVADLQHATSGTPAAGFGAALRYGLKTTTNSNQIAALVSAVWGTATHASRKAYLKFDVYDTAAREALRLEASGSAAMIGFYGTAPVVQPTALTAQLTTITHTAPGTPDYALQNLIDSGVGSAWGFATQDEGNTTLSVIANLQTRVDELETKLQASGLVA